MPMGFLGLLVIFYHNVKVIGSDEEQFRLRLVWAFSQTMKNALGLLGIEVIEEM